MRKLSKSITDLKPFYDVVIIGSGYGGSIAASRFARAGLSVCLLEKGKEFQPGEYPDTLAEAEAEMQLNTNDRQAVKNGLYDFHVGEGISVFKGCGLGGTSQVNAGVVIKPESAVFNDKRWPAAIREDMDSLEKGYQAAYEMLKPSTYPANTDGYPELEKSKAMRISAEQMGQPFNYTDINVSFKSGLNHVGVEQKKCNNCGDCVTGCNHSAKNTLIMNYLPDAVNYGTEIFCNTDVNHVAKSGDNWITYFEVFGSERDKFNAPLQFVRSAKVIIAGGALGSTEILLRSKQAGLPLSSKLGEHFTGNGDVLGFAYNCEQPINGMGLGKLCDDAKYPPVGPCITSIIDMRNQPVLEDGMTFEEGTIPAPIVSLMNVSLLSLSSAIGHNTNGSFSDWLRDCGEEANSLIRGPYHGATSHTQTYLVMTHDDGSGKMNLDNGKLSINWPGVGKEEIFKKVEKAMLDATKALGGTFIRNILWSKLLKYELVTVHPLGGCNMAEDASMGVTDHIGNVFAGDSGSTTHAGLYVLDGSIVPLPLGTNPLFTISALAERACKIILRRMNLETRYDFPPAKSELTLPGTAVQFTETMKGFFSTAEKNDFQKGYETGEQHCSPILFTLTIETESIDKFANDPQHPGYMSGTVIAPALSDYPLTISNGLFNLFVKDEDNPEHLKMKYNMQLNTYDGKSYYFYGYKEVDGRSPFDLWHATTVLYTTIYTDVDKTQILGKGILKIRPQDFATQMTTMKAVNETNMMDGLKAVESFSKFFSTEIIDSYFKKFF
ncbi:GMC family oxidoreductase N-terminal domain-containing protein [Pedobacter sp. L105]|uniref:GMC family oxidoreductase N-terminal domain-containing protein n=1 Tax=Pedobacter sp. L105 TaxID=1641871 RepID=UPI00131C5F88|nr:GMC family oxidoreductase N-terminal domain-containing protein [Pedobacter sp. L105]